MRTLRQIKDLINNMAKKKNINPYIILKNSFSRMCLLL